MSKIENFKSQINSGYQCKGDYIVLGAAMLDGEAVEETLVKAPLSTFNRHGLIAGATGTGKTKTLQVIAENLADKGVPVLLMDVKGDLSGIAKSGTNHPKIEERHEKIGIPYEPAARDVEMLSLSDEPGVKLRATVSEFGPVLFSKILGLNDTQAGIVTILFKYCDDNALPLLDLKDFKKVIQFATGDGKEEMEELYGAISKASTSTIIRKIVELEQQGADSFFGETSFDVEDLVRYGTDNKGLVSILRLTDIQDKPKLFSTFMLCLLAEIYSKFPEEGDIDKPKLVLFIDEAHLIFDEASKALMNQLESVIKLIRSKAVGIFFVTQNPTDIPDSILSQLGMKVQHALRAFTAKDRKMIKLTAENYPISEFYNTNEMLTSLGIGQAAITVLNEKGIPTPLAATLLRAPRSRMDILSDSELNAVIAQSEIIDHYNKEIDRESAYEILGGKIKRASREINKDDKNDKTPTRTTKKNTKKKEKSAIEKFAGSSTGKMIIREVARGLLGALGVPMRGRRLF